MGCYSYWKSLYIYETFEAEFDEILRNIHSYRKNVYFTISKSNCENTRAENKNLYWQVTQKFV